jgi:hypothetical protein
MEWKDRWRKDKDRWKTEINIFEDLESEDLMAYLIIKDKPKERNDNE